MAREVLISLEMHNVFFGLVAKYYSNVRLV